MNVWWIVVPLLALLGTPLFAVLALTALLAFSAAGISSAAVATEMVRLAGSPVLIAIPLFTFAGYLLSESQAPTRLVRITQALLGWMHGGLAIVALAACALFTAFTGASGVTIIALGALLYPALMKAGYKEDFSLGLITKADISNRYARLRPHRILAIGPIIKNVLIKLLCS